MATTLKQVGAVAVYPAAPGGLSPAATALDPAMIWERIEAYICRRFTARAVGWNVEGPGDREPPLIPAAFGLAEVWLNESCSTVTPSLSPLGGVFLPLAGPYRIAVIQGTDFREKMMAEIG